MPGWNSENIEDAKKLSSFIDDDWNSRFVRIGCFFVSFVCISTAVICYFCPKTEDRLHLSIKNGQVHFILHSVCTIFARNS